MSEQQVLLSFSKINVEQVENQLTALLDDNRAQLQQLLVSNSHPQWSSFMQPLEELDDRLHHFWSPISHLNGVCNSTALREVYRHCLPKLSQYHTEIGHNRQLYEAIKMIEQQASAQQLNSAQCKILENDLRDFKLSGVALDDQQKKQFAQLSEQLSQLCNRFEENVMDATRGFSKQITDQQQLAGLPELAIATAKSVAQSLGQDGWVFTLDIPSYLAVMTYADSRELREEMYRAYVTRASELGPNAEQWDNSQVMQQILQCRLQLAKLLGFENFAEYSLATKMVKKPQQVLDFIQQLVKASYDKAKQEVIALTEFAKQNLSLDKLEAWDVAYASEKLRQQRYAVSQEELRPYFPEDRVVAGLFTIVNKLYGITVKQVKNADVWHPDARCYAIYHVNGELISYFYMDLYAREDKRGGAWMDDFQGRRRLANGQLQLPIATITCNFNPPVGEMPCLMTHDEVLTLFHEFGHSLQHMLTKIDYVSVSGINGVPWDAVELASQFLEHWAWEYSAIQLFSGHYQTGEVLPEKLYQRLFAAKNFQSAMSMLRQLEFSWFDFRLHMEFDDQQVDQVQTILDEVREQVSVLPAPNFNRFQHSFSHIFAGGYAAGYYSYKWAEVMASDAFSLFKERGIFDSDTSQKFLETILAQGGAQDPLDLFVCFRGREPDVRALLVQSGIVE